MAGRNDRNQEDGNVRERLLKAAIALFAENGYAATSIREIVARAGVTKPVLYYYFGSKEGLFHTIIEEAAAKQKLLFDEALSGEGTVRDRINMLCHRVYSNIRQNRDLMKMIQGSIFGPDKSAPAYNFLEFRNRAIETIKQMCREGMDRGELTQGEPRLMAQLLLAILDSSILVDLNLTGEDRPERISQMLTLAFEGLSRKGTRYA